MSILEIPNNRTSVYTRINEIIGNKITELSKDENKNQKKAVSRLRTSSTKAKAKAKAQKAKDEIDQYKIIYGQAVKYLHPQYHDTPGTLNELKTEYNNLQEEIKFLLNFTKEDKVLTEDIQTLIRALTELSYKLTSEIQRNTSLTINTALSTVSYEALEKLENAAEKLLENIQSASNTLSNSEEYDGTPEKLFKSYMKNREDILQMLKDSGNFPFLTAENSDDILERVLRKLLETDEGQISPVILAKNAYESNMEQRRTDHADLEKQISEKIQNYNNANTDQPLESLLNSIEAKFKLTLAPLPKPKEGKYDNEPDHDTAAEIKVLLNLGYISDLQKTLQKLQKTDEKKSSEIKNIKQIEKEQKDFDALSMFIEKITNSTYIERQEKFLQKNRDNIQQFNKIHSSPELGLSKRLKALFKEKPDDIKKANIAELSALYVGLSELVELVEDVQKFAIDALWDPNTFMSANENKAKALFDSALKEYSTRKQIVLDKIQSAAMLKKEQAPEITLYLTKKGKETPKDIAALITESQELESIQQLLKIGASGGADKLPEVQKDTEETMKAIYTERIKQAKQERDTKNDTLFKEFTKNINHDDDKIDDEIRVFKNEAETIENEFKNQKNKFKKTYIESFNIQMKKSFPENELSLYIDETESLSKRFNLVLKSLQASLANNTLSEDEQNKTTLQITNLTANIKELDNTLQELEETKEDIDEWKNNVTDIVLNKITSRAAFISEATELITEKRACFNKLQTFTPRTALNAEHIKELRTVLKNIQEGEEYILRTYFITPLTGVAEAEEAGKQCYHAMQQLAGTEEHRSIHDYAQYSYASMRNTFNAIQTNALAEKASTEKALFKAKHDNILIEYKVSQKQKTGLPSFFLHTNKARNQQIQDLQAAVNKDMQVPENITALKDLINTQSEALKKERRLWGRESAFAKVLSVLHTDLGELLHIDKNSLPPLPHELPKTPTHKKRNR